MKKKILALALCLTVLFSTNTVLACASTQSTDLELEDEYGISSAYFPSTKRIGSVHFNFAQSSLWTSRPTGLKVSSSTFPSKRMTASTSASHPNMTVGLVYYNSSNGSNDAISTSTMKKGTNYVTVSLDNIKKNTTYYLYVKSQTAGSNASGYVDFEAVQ